MFQYSALASSVADSLREGSGSGLALHERTSGLLNMPVALARTLELALYRADS